MLDHKVRVRCERLMAPASPVYVGATGLVTADLGPPDDVFAVLFDDPHLGWCSLTPRQWSKDHFVVLPDQVGGL